MTKTKLKKVKKVKRKPLARTPRALLSPKGIDYTNQMLACLPPAQLKRMLLGIFLVYLEHEHERLPNNFKEMVNDFYVLFHFLDKIEEEMR